MKVVDYIYKKNILPKEFCKEVLKEILDRKRNDDDTKITHSEYLQRVNYLTEDGTHKTSQ